MKKIGEVEIVSTNGMNDAEKYNAQLKALILTPEGTLPGSRGFGLPMDFLSKPVQEAINIMALELEEKLQQFIPAITIANMEGEITPQGTMNVRVFIERRP